ncbi:MAG: hypothetical protein BMS9Abin12_0508 [Acidimicrobiia bacterium]|nr:MAG: hypothetical protein BMS9Abin12_0508 [Acidimicrobiia bacterium]
MGQRIEIESSQVVDDSVIITTDRSLTGTDGEGYSSADQASSSSTFGAKLASDLFESDDAISRVYIASNVVVIRREDGWSDDTKRAAAEVITEFFVFY